MSYCRWGQHSDVYCYRVANGQYCTHDTYGENFCDGGAGDAADRLEELRARGRLVPQYAIDALRAIAADASDASASCEGLWQ